MGREIERWVCKQRTDGPAGFDFAVMSGSETIAWVARREDAEFIARARDVVPRLVDEIILLMSGIDNIRNFVHTLDINLHQLDAEMKDRL
jgi:hypothetical protein